MEFSDYKRGAAFNSCLVVRPSRVTLAGPLASHTDRYTVPPLLGGEAIVVHTREGEGWVRHVSGDFVCSEGEVFVLTSDELLEVKPNRGKWSNRWFHCRGALVDQIVDGSPFSSRTLPVECPKSSQIPRMMHLITDEFERRNDHFQEAATAYAQAVVIELLRLFQPKCADASRAEDVPARVCAYVREHMDRPIAVSEVSDHLRLSERQLNRIIKASTGETVRQYVQRLKLSHAMDLLASSDLSIVDVSRDVGFTDPLYFSRVFRRQVSVSPSEYRELTGAHRGRTGRERAQTPRHSKLRGTRQWSDRTQRIELIGSI